MTDRVAPTGQPQAPGPIPAPAPSRPPSAFLVHDLVVLLVAALVLGGAHLWQARRTGAGLSTFARGGLVFRHPAGWFSSGDPSAELPLHVVIASSDPVDPHARIDARVLRTPPLPGGLASALALNRPRAHGGPAPYDLYQQLSSETVLLSGRPWLRTRFAYAFRPSEDDAPAIGWAIEYAAAVEDRLYLVTVHGSERGVERLDGIVSAALAVRLP